LIVLAFNRYEFMNVDGHLMRIDRLSGEALWQRGKTYYTIETPEMQKMKQEAAEKNAGMKLLRQGKSDSEWDFLNELNCR